MNPILKLDLTQFDSAPFVSVGVLSKDMVNFIIERKPQLKDILKPDIDILFWKNRIAHTERHRKDFFVPSDFDICLENIPAIIQNPDYISVHPKDNSISFIKDFSAHVAVAVRISTDGKLSYRTMYPLMDAQLTHYIDTGFAWKYQKQL